MVVLRCRPGELESERERERAECDAMRGARAQIWSGWRVGERYVSLPSPFKLARVLTHPFCRSCASYAGECRGFLSLFLFRCSFSLSLSLRAGPVAACGLRVPPALLVGRRQFALAAKYGNSAAPYDAALFCGGGGADAAPMCVWRGDGDSGEAVSPPLWALRPPLHPQFGGMAIGDLMWDIGGDPTKHQWNLPKMISGSLVRDGFGRQTLRTLSSH
ncbi:hypothetical protein DFH09DRAFT_1181601 [Mycena vulgaris]|nr:hypothetical protein DFH09DRAFT_1181601 [Mycena vulgaris]